MPNVKPSSILKLEKLMRSDNCDIGTLASKITNNNELPSLIGYDLMDVLPFLEKLGIKVEVIGSKGKVKSQSISSGTFLNKIDKIILQVS